MARRTCSVSNNVKKNNQIQVSSKFSTIESRLKLFKDIAYTVTHGSLNMSNNVLKEVYNNAFKYCNLQDGAFDIRKGLFLYGSIGSGKTTLLKVISEYMKIVYPMSQIKNIRAKSYDQYSLLDDFKGYCGGFKSINASSIANECKSALKDFNPLDYYSGLNEVCFDEIGREPNPVVCYGTNLNVFEHILAVRYDNWQSANSLEDVLNKRTHMTTNINMENEKGVLSLKDLSLHYGAHIADRIREMCNIVKLDVETFRKNK